jgi:hypothetical protein
VQYSKHYTIEEARALLPLVRQWLSQLETHHKRLLSLDERIAALLAKGDDAGGEIVNQSIKILAEIQQTLHQFRQRQIQVKDLRRGLLDFPSLRNGREVFLCWEKDEDDIEFWHDLEAGYPGRERL